MARLRSDINVTPLVDIVLVLLIVFIVLVPVVPHALATTLPTPDGPGRGGPALRLSLLADGRVALAGAVVPPGAWPALVRATTGPVILSVSPDLPLSRVTEVLDQVKGLRPEAPLRVVAATGGPGRVLP